MTSGSSLSIAESKMKHSTSQGSILHFTARGFHQKRDITPVTPLRTNTDKQQKHFFERLQLGHICHLSLGSYLSSQSSWQTDSAIIAACLQNTEYTWMDPWYTHTTAAAHTKTHTMHVSPSLCKNKKRPMKGGALSEKAHAGRGRQSIFKIRSSAGHWAAGRNSTINIW